MGSLQRATPSRESTSALSATAVLLAVSLIANVLLARTAEILYLDNVDMRAYVDTVVGNFRCLKPYTGRDEQ